MIATEDPPPINTSRQRNVLTLVGNGFDLQALKHFNAATPTSYQDFHRFAHPRLIGNTNPIFEEIRRVRLGPPADPDWSDIEVAISNLDPSTFHYRDLKAPLTEVRSAFSRFLNHAVNPDIMAELDAYVSSNGISIHSFAHLLEDIEDPGFLRSLTDTGFGSHHTDFNFRFVNFNYTSLLDNYLHLDPLQYDPQPYKVSSNDFRFNDDPLALLTPDTADNVQSCTLRTSVIHPHGQQAIPRSMLFGTGEILDPATPRARVTKPFWARYIERYSVDIERADLFILFGCSIGESDTWWWRHIASALTSNPSKHLMIYSYGNRDRDATLELFFERAGITSSEGKAIALQMHVVSYNSSTDHTYLGFAPECTKCRTDPKGLGYRLLSEYD